MQPQDAALIYAEDENLKKKPRESWQKVLLRVLISAVVIGLGVFLILFCVAKAAQYDSIASMWRHMSGELALMWQRITA